MRVILEEPTNEQYSSIRNDANHEHHHISIYHVPNHYLAQADPKYFPNGGGGCCEYHRVLDVRVCGVDAVARQTSPIAINHLMAMRGVCRNTKNQTNWRTLL